jgi:hypothetical protein
MEITPIDEEMYRYFVQLTDDEKRYFANMIKNFLQKRQANNYNEKAEANFEASENCSQEEASDMANGWLHGK